MIFEASLFLKAITVPLISYAVGSLAGLRIKALTTVPGIIPKSSNLLLTIPVVVIFLIFHTFLMVIDVIA